MGNLRGSVREFGNPRSCPHHVDDGCVRRPGDAARSREEWFPLAVANKPQGNVKLTSYRFAKGRPGISNSRTIPFLGA